MDFDLFDNLPSMANKDMIKKCFNANYYSIIFGADDPWHEGHMQDHSQLDEDPTLSDDFEWNCTVTANQAMHRERSIHFLDPRYRYKNSELTDRRDAKRDKYRKKYANYKEKLKSITVATWHKWLINKLSIYIYIYICCFQRSKMFFSMLKYVI